MRAFAPLIAILRSWFGRLCVAITISMAAFWFAYLCELQEPSGLLPDKRPAALRWLDYLTTWRLFPGHERDLWFILYTAYCLVACIIIVYVLLTIWVRRRARLHLKTQLL
jgi:hypothetical protein